MQSVEKMLRETGIKVTPQRTAIMEILLDTREHPGVESIYKQVKSRFTSISLATVYKTVELFVRNNLIQELNLTSDFTRYDAWVVPHPHVSCLRCGRVEDMEGCSPGKEAALPGQLSEEEQVINGYKITRKETMYFGLCPRCRP